MFYLLYLGLGSILGFWVSIVAQKTKKAAKPNISNFKLMIIGIVVWCIFTIAWPIAGTYCIYKMVDNHFTK